MLEEGTVSNSSSGNAGNLPPVVLAGVQVLEGPEKQPETPPAIYDASARNRFEYTVRSGGNKYDVGHVFGPLSDQRYLQFLNDLNVRGTADKIEEDSREATVALWNEQIVEVEGVEYDPASDWKQFIDDGEKLQAMNDYLAVAIKDAEASKSGSKLKLGPAPTTQTVTTEAFFNGEIVYQDHVLVAKTPELEKRYDRIQSKRVKQEPTRGLRRAAKVEYVPQDEKLGELYDGMWRGTTGFGNDEDIPLRFKVIVMHYIFTPTLDPKLLGK